jgi:hypothetical protein
VLATELGEGYGSSWFGTMLFASSRSGTPTPVSLLKPVVEHGYADVFFAFGWMNMGFTRQPSFEL